MNILYVAFIDFSMMHFGPAKKVLNACRALESEGNTVTLLGRCGTTTVKVAMDGSMETLGTHRAYPVGKVQTLIDKSAQIRDIEKYIASRSFDFC